MFFKKAKRVMAGICVWSMLFTSIDQSAIVALAAEDTSVVADVAGNKEVPEEIPVAEDSDFTEMTEVKGTSDGGSNIQGNGYTFDAATGTLTFDADVVGIVDNAFPYPKDGDEFLAAIKTIQFEEGAVVKIIGIKAFCGLPNLEKLDLSNCSKLTTIRSEAFSGCAKLGEIKFPAELQEIGNKAFYGCKEIETLTLPPGLINIENNAFDGCVKLSTVIVGENIPKCGTNIFKDCAIENIQFTSNNTVVPANLFNGATFADGARIVIPYFIQEIGEGAFNGCKTLKSVTFEDTQVNPSALASIAKNAFNNCETLASVTFPDSVKVIEEGAYTNCKALTALVIPNTVTVLGKAAFKGCIGIENLTISNAISSLGESVFEECSSLTVVEIPSGIEMISASMFKKCTRLGTVTVPTTVKTVGNSAFEGCEKLSTIVLPDTVTTVGNTVFKGCIRLENPTMPKDLEVYGDSLFE